MSNNSTLLSLILCSRNDSYMGNSGWRLETSINLSLIHAKEANFLDKLEIIISDWGSETPLFDVLDLIPEAKSRVKFVYIPPDKAKIQQKDSKFPEVIALNAAARRASGKYIGRIDNDTIVGRDFFENFNNLLQRKNSLWFDPENAFMFIERRSIPFRFSSQSYPLNYVYDYIQSYGKKLVVETARTWGFPFWWSPVGIMIFHKKIWVSCRGYDETLIYWGWMEGDIALRLNQKHLLIDFKDCIGNDLYHLEHYPSLTAYKDRNGPATPRKKNEPKFSGLKYQVNSPGWGVYEKNIKLFDYILSETKRHKIILMNPSYLRIIKMKLCFFKCNILRKIDRLRLYLPEFYDNMICLIKIKLGKIRNMTNS